MVIVMPDPRPATNIIIPKPTTDAENKRVVLLNCLIHLNPLFIDPPEGPYVSSYIFPESAFHIPY